MRLRQLPKAPSRVGNVFRVSISLSIIALMFVTTYAGTDDWFPFAPMRMYSDTEDLTGTQSSLFTMLVNEEGRRFHQLESNTAIRRAEIEGQRERFENNPDDLKYIAEAYAFFRPNQPDIVLVEVVEETWEVVDGRPVGDHTFTVVAAWERPESSTSAAD